MGVDTSNNGMKDFDSHELTYHGFILLVKWSIAVVVVTLIGMAYFLT